MPPEHASWRGSWPLRRGFHRGLGLSWHLESIWRARSARALESPLRRARLPSLPLRLSCTSRIYHRTHIYHSRSVAHCRWPHIIHPDAGCNSPRKWCRLFMLFVGSGTDVCACLALAYASFSMSHSSGGAATVSRNVASIVRCSLTHCNWKDQPFWAWIKMTET